MNSRSKLMDTPAKTWGLGKSQETVLTLVDDAREWSGIAGGKREE